MPSVKKLVEKMKNQPNGIRPEEADKVLKAYGFEATRMKGSHKFYEHLSTREAIILQWKSPLKRAYVEEILKKIGE